MEKPPRRKENIFYITIILLSLLIIVYILYKPFTTGKNGSTIFTNSIPVNCNVQNIYFSREREPVSVKYDTLQKGKIYLLSLIIHNPDYRPLIITDISTSCSCTGYIINKKILDSYDTTGIRIFFNAKNKAGNQTLGLWFNIQGDTIPQKLYLTGYVTDNLLTFKP